MIKPLDFVRAKGKRSDSVLVKISDQKGIEFVQTPGEAYEDRYIGLVTEVSSDGTCSVEWIGDGNKHLHNAWWEQENLEKEDSLPHLLAREMAHPFGNNRREVDKYYKDL